MPILADVPQVNMHEAKTHLSRIAAEVESGRYPYYIVSRHGRPVVKIVPYEDEPAPRRRLNLAYGVFEVPDDIDFCNDEITEMFGA